MAAPREFDPVTVGTALAAYVVVQGRRVAAGAMSQTSFDTYARDVNLFADFVTTERVLDEVDEADVDDALVAYATSSDARFKVSPSGGKSQASVARYRASIAGFFAFAEKEGFIRRNPMPGTVVKPKPGTPEHSRTALPLETALTVIDTPTGSMAERDTLILCLLMETGARVGELCAIDISDIREAEGSPWLTIRNGKGGKQRILPLTRSTWAAIQEYVEVRPTPYVKDESAKQEDSAKALFLTHRGRRITPRDVQNICARVSARLPHTMRRDFTPHALRHTMATVALSEGTADIASIQRILGHASLATTGKYIDEVRKSLVKAVEGNLITGS
jgi:site-specific recombinase XerD